MPTETWVPRPPGGTETTWDGGETIWDANLSGMQAQVPDTDWDDAEWDDDVTLWDAELSDILALAPPRTLWDGDGRNEVWTPRPPGTLP